MNSRQPFDWSIRERFSWPPANRPKLPLGASAIEVIRSCPLRGCFESSRGYERRQGFASRVGTAFHRTLQSLAEQPPRAASLEAVSQEALRRFDERLREQEAKAAQRPRERHLPRDQRRIDRAREAVIVEAQRLWHPLSGGVHLPAAPLGASSLGSHELTEVEVRSADGLFVGHIDRVERSPQGTQLVDYKSAVRPDVPERFERQLQLYAWLWHDTHDEWPVEATVVYPFLSERRQVDVSPALCEAVAQESAETLVGLYLEASIERLATPGDVCKVCEFRPWCRPFWQWQEQERNQTIVWSRAELGMEGTIERVRLTPGWCQVWFRWRGVVVQLNAPANRFEHLAEARRGQRVRVLEARLIGARQQPQARVTDYTEVFLLR